MNWIRNHPLLTLLSLALLLFAGSSLAVSHYSVKVREAERAAAISEARAEVLDRLAQESYANGQKQEAQAQEVRKQLVVTEQARKRAAARIADLEANQQPIPDAPVDGGPVDPGERESWRRAVESRDALNVALKEQLANDEVALAQANELAETFHKAADHYSAAYLQEQAARGEDLKAIASLKIALEAQKGLTKAAYWRGFFHGSVAGYGAGNALPLRRP